MSEQRTSAAQPALRNASDADFAGHVDEWLGWRDAPWGRMHSALVASVLDATLKDVDTPARVLDIGGGDGTDAVRLAAKGHEVTLVDHSGPLLDRARSRATAQGVARQVRTLQADLESAAEVAGPDPFDLVLCHNVLHYRDDIVASLHSVAACVRAGGVLSVIAPNPDAEVLSSVVRIGEIGDAVTLLDAPTTVAYPFLTTVVRIRPESAAGVVREAGFTIFGRYGGPCVTDLIQAEEKLWDRDYYRQLLDLESKLYGRTPFRDVGRFWHLLARADGTAGR